MRWSVTAVAVYAVFATHRAWGHGQPIFVDVVAGKLTISTGMEDPFGYARQVLADPDPESWFMPASAADQFTTLPGFDITGMNAGEADFTPRLDDAGP
jgi:hypothetical protein